MTVTNSSTIDLATFTDFEGLSLKSFDYEKCVNDFSTHGDKKKIRVFPFMFQDSLLTLTVKGEVITNGVAVNTWQGGNPSYSLGVTFQEEMVYVKFNKLLDICAAHFPSTWSVTPCIKDEVCYLKLKPKNDKKTFSTKSNVKLEVKKIHEADINRGQEVTVTFSLSVYLNMDEEKTGLVITPLDLQFE